MSSSPRLVIGCMSGTSLDGIDVALLEIEGYGLDMIVTFVQGASLAFDPSLSSRLRLLAENTPMTAEHIAILSRELALAHLQAIQKLDIVCNNIESSAIDLIAVHGQTVFHSPPFHSWQLFCPTPLSHALQVPVVCDLRAADIAAGGQGAPITPIADFVLFRDRAATSTTTTTTTTSSSSSPPLSMEMENRAVINLGGFCNVTIVRGGSGESGGGERGHGSTSLCEQVASCVSGRDVCATNQLLDLLARTYLGLPYDDNGGAAMTGNALPEVVHFFESRLALQSNSKRSLGTRDEPSKWLREKSDEYWAALSPQDILRSACQAVARVISSSLLIHIDSDEDDGKNEASACVIVIHRILAAGGGVRNEALMLELSLLHPCVQTTASLGIDPMFREAAEMAVLGVLCQDEVPITLQAVTGCQGEVAPIAGSWVFPSYKKKHRAASSSSPPPTAAPAAAIVAEITSALPRDRKHVATEQINERSRNLHEKSVAECVDIIAHEDASSLPSTMLSASPSLCSFIEAAAARGFVDDGRLVYLGAGTSGRLGVLDASEAPPTFNFPHDKIIGVIAGGDRSLRFSSEGAEDDPNGAIQELGRLNITYHDSVIGISAGGSTPYVLGALAYLESLPLASRPLTALMCCALPSTEEASADSGRIIIHLPSGQEVLTGSTRMKAGSVTKLALNTISTVLAIQCGKVYDNLMVDVRARNEKLVDRALRIISAVTSISDRSECLELLERAGGSCKVAIVLWKLGTGRGGGEVEITLEEATRILEKAKGRLVDCI